MNTLKREKSGSGRPVWVLALIFGTVSALSITPQVAVSADVVVGGQQVVVQEPDVAQQDMQQPITQNEEDNLTAGEIDTSEYDLILEIPIEVENMYPVVTRFRLNCTIGKRLGDAGTNFVEGTWQTSSIQVMLENGFYSGTFRYYFTLLPNQAPEDVDFRVCRSGIWHQDFNSYYTPSQVANPDNVPAWQRLDPEESHAWSFAPIEW